MLEYGNVDRLSLYGLGGLGGADRHPLFTFSSSNRNIITGQLLCTKCMLHLDAPRGGRIPPDCVPSVGGLAWQWVLCRECSQFLCLQPYEWRVERDWI